MHIGLGAIVKHSLETKRFVSVSLKAKLKREKDGRYHLFLVFESLVASTSYNSTLFERKNSRTINH